MKAIFPMLTVCMTVFLLASGCSREEQPPPPSEKPKVVKRIVRPEPTIPKESEPAPEETTPSVRASRNEKAPGAPEEEKEKSSPQTMPAEEPKVVEEDTGHYVVKRGESLAAIAGKAEIYGDPMKWTILCRYTMDELAPLATGVDFPERELPEGMRLKIVDPEERQRNLGERTDFNWAVNVQSAVTKKEIAPSAIRLVKEGYPVYFTRVRIKGKDWLRLRVGFFKTRAEADREGKKIMALLKFDDLWVTKVGEMELAEFGGY